MRKNWEKSGEKGEKREKTKKMEKTFEVELLNYSHSLTNSTLASTVFCASSPINNV